MSLELIKRLQNAQTHIASSRARCDQDERYRWDTIDDAIAFIKVNTPVASCACYSCTEIPKWRDADGDTFCDKHRHSLVARI